MRLYIRNLPPTATADLLRTLFAPYQSLVSAQVALNEDTGGCHGWGFAEFSDATEAQRAITHVNGTPLNGQVLAVTSAHHQGSRRPRRAASRQWR